MTALFNTQSRFRPLIDFCAIVALGYLLKIVLDQFIWRYSGPVSLGIMLSVILFYLRSMGESWAWIGLVKIKSRRGFVLLPFQTLLALFAILATASALSLAGEALGLDFMKPDNSRAQDRFGDVAGNTRLYIFWLSIVWFAGPAEELYFRGFMIGKLREALGNSTWASALSVLIPALIFGLGHVYYLGLRGLVTTGGIAVTLGVLYILYKRNIWPLMIAHGAANTLTFTVVYLQLEA
ncbi:CPBP family intramembrane metalloprotease [Erythrobacter sp. SCSIO 43205]|uniref:CPBP family intramembrane glutamic endopeptidase n=1 Tax=Erythrobacter sp. SCSIO 43205 TaxID=2779361 RepID=UPI001CA89D66|nr:type II CAAX endopeptidase family protein [Erythrobacter sp. SCSIO 43205]UAB79012.1 CPBP family intramembrane metalloprotease [Erythrobacter sp. SCSIO 43205]